MRIAALYAHGPVPERLMLCGLVGSLPTVTSMLALSGDPPPVGVNVTAIVHDELADTVEPQVPPVTLKSVAFAPLKLSITDSGNPDLLVTVTSLVFVGAFAVSVPYAKVTGVTFAGTVGPVMSVTTYGLSGSRLSATDSIADSVPSAPGLKVTVIVHPFSAPSVPEQVPPVIEKSAALVPLKLSLSVTG
jgi:hypothetical protein